MNVCTESHCCCLFYGSQQQQQQCKISIENVGIEVNIDGIDDEEGVTSNQWVAVAWHGADGMNSPGCVETKTFATGDEDSFENGLWYQQQYFGANGEKLVRVGGESNISNFDNFGTDETIVEIVDKFVDFEFHCNGKLGKLSPTMLA